MVTMPKTAAGKDARLPDPFKIHTWTDSEVARESDDESPSIFGSDEQSEVIRELFPELFPQSPSIAARKAFKALENPYLEDGAAVTERHRWLRRARRLDSGVVNGYLKFVMRSRGQNDFASMPPGASNMTNDMGVHHRNTNMPNLRPGDNVARLPPGYGSNAKIDATDRKILRFCMYLTYPSILSHPLIPEDRYISSLWRPHLAAENECLVRSRPCNRWGRVCETRCSSLLCWVHA